ncbi:hypothetical protein PCA31118_05081 [Pandoraea captiosa]|uniref:Uncharacterized protein n=1 Tax=Pandoraea captiosa TaxID=2508302 RepID=A0A5E5AUS2_9BURK|nr:hypothetical protein PCA31118_05081 [Pandoraea captiosa]
MLGSDEWKARVIASNTTPCPSCESPRVMMGACAIGSKTVHQEYVCESCQYEFTALFTLAGCYSGHPNN